MNSAIYKKTTRLVFGLWAVSGTFALGCVALGASEGDDSDRFFASETIPHIRIDLDRTNVNALRQNPRTYASATVREGESVYQNVGIHLKGAAGSFQPIDHERPAFTLNFDKFKDGQKLHGLDKLHLNNSVQDGSLLTEAICTRLFLEAGVPAPVRLTPGWNSTGGTWAFMCSRRVSTAPFCAGISRTSMATSTMAVFSRM
jgi:hypothetical protein